MKNICANLLWVAAVWPLLAVPICRAQTPAGQTAAASAPATPSWSLEQAVTSSVHDAWILGGKSEPGFFAIVKALAELSAEKRGLQLPDKETVGREFGEYIKTQARADHDQLLYVIVDRAVRKYGIKPAAGG
ncbi:MAG TPA: hypothetical protein VMB49_06455 [Acidobacteriaceae bacterium]|nr:hypothetical protein [Acidobacteriaceae bacterium]